jgi:hypothetical protein
MVGESRALGSGATSKTFDGNMFLLFSSSSLFSIALFSKALILRSSST